MLEYLTFSSTDDKILNCLTDYFDICAPIVGPGLKSPEERTMDYLEEVAIQCARGIVNKTIHLSKKKGPMESKLCCELSI